MFLEDWFNNSELRPFLILAGFIALTIVVIAIVEWDHRRHIKLEKQKKNREFTSRTLELVKAYSEEDAAATMKLFRNIEEYRHDFDGPGKAS